MLPAGLALRLQREVRAFDSRVVLLSQCGRQTPGPPSRVRASNTLTTTPSVRKKFEHVPMRQLTTVI